MLEKRLADITEQDILSLIESAVPESKTLDYKQALPGSTSKDRKDFAYDISAFANTAGGVIIFGIAEKRDEEGKTTGLPDEILGIDVAIDAEIRRLESSIQDGIDPRIRGVSFRPIQVKNKTLLLVKVEKSWNSPHMVTLEGNRRFYLRANTQKFEMDTEQLRDAFSQTTSIQEKIEGWRSLRISKIISGESHVKIMDGVFGCIHVVPLSSFGKNVFTTDNLKTGKEYLPVMMSQSVYNLKVNFEGVISTEYADDNGFFDGYVQAFRDGSVESVSHQMFHYDAKSGVMYGNVLMNLIKAAKNAVSFLEKLKVPPPYVAMISFAGVRDVELKFSQMMSRNPKKFDRDVLLIPPVLIENPDRDYSTILKPAIDHIFNSAGYDKCPFYKDQETWTVDE